MNESSPISGLRPEPTDQPGPAEPSAAAVSEELDRILGSDVFGGAARQQRLLRHLVQKRLQGAVTDLKEYTLGVEVFDRGEDFDPRLDPIVRVEASRLRSRLQKYYDGPGSTDTVRITLPRGAYVPAFGYAAAPVEASAPGASDATPALDIPPPSPVSSGRSAPRARSRFWVVVFSWLAATAIGIAVIWVATRQHAAGPPGRFLKFQRVTTDGLLCTSPTFNPNGREIAYARREAGTWQIYERDLKTSALTELTPGSTEDNTEPAWSPDGKTIAFHSDRNSGGVFLLNTKTRAISQLTTAGYYPSWSPDSQRLVISTGTFNDPAEGSLTPASRLQIVDVATKQSFDLTVPETVSSPQQPEWSPHGERIAFWNTDTNGDRDIYTIKAGSIRTQPVAVTHDAWTDWSPAWSPDGSYLYFSSDRGGAMNLWRIGIDERTGAVAGAPEPVTTPSSYSGWLAFASSGREFAYVDRIPFSELYRAPFTEAAGVDLNRKVQLTFGEHSMHEPAMSPNGQWIAVRIEDPQEDLVLVRADGTGLRRLTNDRYSDRSPLWSPDGKQIVFVSNRSGSFQDWAIHPDGTGLRQLTTNGNTAIAWSPDGVLVGYPADGSPFAIEPPGHPLKDWGLPSSFRPIAWAPGNGAVTGRMRSTAFGRQSLFVFTPANNDFWEIAQIAPYPSTVWLNRDQLLFSRDDGFYLADLRSHDLKEVAATAHTDIRSHFTVSPDGRDVFFVQSNDEEDIWTGGE